MVKNSTLFYLYENKHQTEPLLIDIRKFHEELDDLSAKLDKLQFQVSDNVLQKVFSYI